MPTYAIGRLTCDDWSWLTQYGPTTAALIEKHGGRYLVRGGDMQHVEGSQALPSAIVMLEFPSMEKARAWYDDPEYAPMIELRKKHSQLEFVFVDGLPD